MRALLFTLQTGMRVGKSEMKRDSPFSVTFCSFTGCVLQFQVCLTDGIKTVRNADLISGVSATPLFPVSCEFCFDETREGGRGGGI